MAGRDLPTLLAVAAQLTAAVKLSLQSFVIIIIIALLLCVEAAWVLLSVHWILIGTSRAGPSRQAEGRHWINGKKLYCQARGLWWAGTGQSEARAVLSDQWGARELWSRSALDRPSTREWRMTLELLPRLRSWALIGRPPCCALIGQAGGNRDWGRRSLGNIATSRTKFGTFISDPRHAVSEKYSVKVFLWCLFPIMTKLTYWHIIENF